MYQKEFKVCLTCGRLLVVLGEMAPKVASEECPAYPFKGSFSKMYCTACALRCPVIGHGVTSDNIPYTLTVAGNTDYVSAGHLIIK